MGVQDFRSKVVVGWRAPPSFLAIPLPTVLAAGVAAGEAGVRASSPFTRRGRFGGGFSLFTARKAGFLIPRRGWFSRGPAFRSCTWAVGSGNPDLRLPGQNLACLPCLESPKFVRDLIEVSFRGGRALPCLVGARGFFRCCGLGAIMRQ